MIYEFRDGTVLEISYDDGIRIDEWVNDGGEGSGNFGHSGRKGSVGGSSKTKLSQSERNQYNLLLSLMKEQTKIKGVSPRGENHMPYRWTAKEQKHPTHAKHLIEYGIGFAAYTKMAQELLSKPVDDEKILGYSEKDGILIRYNVETGDYAVGSPRSGIITMFKPERGLTYFLENMKEDALVGGYK